MPSNEFSELVNLISDFRNLTHESALFGKIRANKVQWNQLCSALDTFTDTTICIDNFLINEEIEEYYQAIPIVYGILQSSVMQYDALCTIANILEHKIENNFDSCKTLRSIRVHIAGHPSSINHKNGKSSTMTFSGDFSTYEFRYILYDGGTGKGDIIDVNLRRLLQQQIEELSDCMKRIIEFSKKEVERIKHNWKQDSLYEHFVDMLAYAIEKIASGCSKDLACPIVISQMESITSKISFVEKELAIRGGCVSDFLGIDDTINNIRIATNYLMPYHRGLPSKVPKELAHLISRQLVSDIEKLREQLWQIENA